MGNKTVHQQDYIPATRNENKNAGHKRSKREFALAASKYRAIHDNADICPDCAGWGDERGTFGYCKGCDGTGRVNR